MIKVCALFIFCVHLTANVLNILHTCIFKAAVKHLLLQTILKQPFFFFCCCSKNGFNSEEPPNHKKEHDRSDARYSWETPLHSASIYCIPLIWEAGSDRLINVSLLSLSTSATPTLSPPKTAPASDHAAAQLTTFTEVRGTWLLSYSPRMRDTGAFLDRVNPESRGLWWGVTGANAEH